MNIRSIDERDSTGLIDSPTYRVFDWVGEAALDGETTALHAYELTDAGLWEVLDWMRDSRDPLPSLSELYVCTPGDQGVTLVFLGSIARHRSTDGTSQPQQSMMRL